MHSHGGMPHSHGMSHGNLAHVDNSEENKTFMFQVRFWSL